MKSEKHKEVPDKIFLDDANRIVNEAQNKDIIIRVVGSVAIRMHCMDFADMHIRLARLGEIKRSFVDLDFVSYSKQRKQIEPFFANEIKYIPDRHINAYFGYKRLLFYHPQGYYHTDIIFDKLEFSHDIFFGNKPGEGRLEVDTHTIPLAELILHKLQIHDINEKDFKDMIVLLRAHEIDDRDEKEIINAKYIAKILANDWGFWYDAKANLEHTKPFAGKYLTQQKIDQIDYNVVIKKIDILLDYIEQEPKSKKWMKRAKTGIKKPWWRHVEEVVR
ncbi:MAG: hypothetical protein ACE5R6_15270 [Candidatus Heimdallarchaeota archaeon]